MVVGFFFSANKRGDTCDRLVSIDYTLNNKYQMFPFFYTSFLRVFVDFPTRPDG